jgi:hypothetical protein
MASGMTRDGVGHTVATVNTGLAILVDALIVSSTLLALGVIGVLIARTRRAGRRMHRAAEAMEHARPEVRHRLALLRAGLLIGGDQLERGRAGLVGLDATMEQLGASLRERRARLDEATQRIVGYTAEITDRSHPDA